MNEEKVPQISEPEYNQLWREVGKQAESLAESLASALKLTWDKASHEARPHLLTLLRQVNDEVQKMINHLEQPEEPAASPETEPEAEMQLN